MEANKGYKRFCALGLPNGAFGLEAGNDKAVYFCTPVGADIIGWLGVDGIHFCFIPSVSNDIVFAVSPMPCGEHYVEPIAHTFEEFLSLILFCKDASPLEQICYVMEGHFCESVKDVGESDCSIQDSVLDILRSEFEIEARSDTYQYVKILQAAFDYTTIPFSDEYYEVTGTERR